MLPCPMAVEKGPRHVANSGAEPSAYNHGETLILLIFVIPYLRTCMNVQTRLSFDHTV